MNRKLVLASLDRNGNFEVPFATQTVSVGRIFLPLVVRNR